jgi:hypothetical protein
MRHAVLALAFLSLPAALWAQEVPSLWRGFDDPPRQEEPQDDPAAEPQEPGEPVPVMEFIYWNSRIEAGVLLTLFDKDLDIETEPGLYARYLLHLNDLWTVSVTYRHYSCGNSDLPGSDDEWLLLRALMVGAGVRAPLTDEFGVEASVSTGAMWWESRDAGQGDDAGWILSGDAAFVVRLHDMMRLKLGAAVDFTRTDFHQDARENMLGLSGFLAIEIGSN